MTNSEIGDDYKTPDPVENPKTASVKHARENALEREEEKLLFDAVENLKVRGEKKEKYEVLITLLMRGGLRIQEAIQVRLDWIYNGEDGVEVQIPQEDYDIRKPKRRWKPKTKQGSRSIIFINQSDGQLVRSFFRKNKSLGLHRVSAWRLIRLLGKKIGEPDLHPHALRSTYANRLVEMGVTETTLMYFMGWSDINTARAYIKSSKSSAKRDLFAKKKAFKRDSED